MSSTVSASSRCPHSPSVPGHRRELWRDERGQTLVFVGVALVALFAMTGFALDMATIVQMRRELQASSDASALAGAQLLPDSTNAIATAKNYSGIKNAKNTYPGKPVVTMDSGYPVTKCLSTTGVPCNPVNAIVVRQVAAVPLFFSRVVGWSSMNVKATATASAKGGIPTPLDILLILDTTSSMNNSCSGTVSGVSNPTRLDCALAGMRALIGALWPCPPSLQTCGTVTNGNVAKAVDELGLMVFPGLKAATPKSWDYDCSNNLNKNDLAPYGSSPVYNIIPLSSDYKTSSSGALNGANSNLVKAVDWSDGVGCNTGAYGVESPGGQGTYFADAITQAQSTLSSTGRANVRDVIILLSDGDANYNGVSNPCKAAVNAAKSAANSGAWVYSIAYGAGSSGCDNDTGITPLQTMQQIASDSSKFYNQPSAGDLTTIFKQVAVTLTTTRLLNDATQ